MRYLKDYEVSEKLKNRTLVVFGIGNDGKTFIEKYKDIVNISFGIDNGGEQTYRDIKIYSYYEALKILKEEMVIVICSRNFWGKMLSMAEKEQVSNEIFVWLPDYSQSIQRLVNFNKKRWKHNPGTENKTKIIIPFEEAKYEESVLYSYFANYLGEEYGAEIVAYVRRGGTRFQPRIFETMKEIYRSFGTTQFLVPEIMNEKMVSDIYEEVLQGIHLLEDWNNIEICGRQWGISIIRDYLRFYELSLDPLCEARKECLYKAIKSILYWNDYFDKNDVKTVILWDGVHNESYLRDVAIAHGVPTYIIHHEGAQKAFYNFNFGEDYGRLKEYYDSLSLDRRSQGTEWAKKIFNQILSGKENAYVPYRGKNNERVFGYSCQENYIEENDKLKVVICPHIFEEDSWNRGWQICENDYMSWFKLLGDYSEKTSYDWYIKMHPDEGQRGISFINEFINEYPSIKLIPAKVSPMYLKNAGVRYAFTIGGSIGHEYPLLGIDVINAGNNPHISFDFNINPTNKEELKKIIMNLEEYSALERVDQIYAFYSMMYLYYKKNDVSQYIRKIFMFDEWKHFSLNDKEKHFVDVINNQLDDYIQKQIPYIFEEMDLWENTDRILGDEEIQEILQKTL